MGLRFWRRFRVAPLTTINVSKSGLSLSLGMRGFHVTLGRNGVRTTAGLPGTGLSWTEHSRYRSSATENGGKLSDARALVRRKLSEEPPSQHSFAEKDQAS